MKGMNVNNALNLLLNTIEEYWRVDVTPKPSVICREWELKSKNLKNDEYITAYVSGVSNTLLGIGGKCAMFDYDITVLISTSGGYERFSLMMREVVHCIMKKLVDDNKWIFVNRVDDMSDSHRLIQVGDIKLIYKEFGGI